VGIEGFFPHDFRDTEITTTRRAGVDHLTITTIAGHKTMAVFKRYNNLPINDFKEAASCFKSFVVV
jgi:hypothetical protein